MVDLAASEQPRACCSPHPFPPEFKRAQVGKYSWRMIREEYRSMTSVVCDNMHDVDYTFNSLQHSQSLDATS